MQTLYLLLFLAAFISFLLHTSDKVVSKVNFLGLGLAFWALVPLIQTFQRVLN